jgi:hypothetical protein
VTAVRQPPLSSILAKCAREPRSDCTALTAGLKATSLEGWGIVIPFAFVIPVLVTGIHLAARSSAR